jgi:hypothetical protein
MLENGMSHALLLANRKTVKYYFKKIQNDKIFKKFQKFHSFHKISKIRVK